MRVLKAEELEAMRRKVDDQHLTTMVQRPPRLHDGTTRIVEIVQHLMEDDEIGAPGIVVEISDIGQADLRRPDVGGSQLCP